MRLLLALTLAWLGISLAGAAERIPPAPTEYCTDEAGFLSPEARARINAQLEQNEKETSNQILVVLYPQMESDSSIEDYTVRVAQSWRVGQKGKDNGAVLFLFAREHKMYIEVGYGLEGALPDALCRRIIGDEIAPKLRAGDRDGGIEAGVNALIAASRGEYRGSGTTVGDKKAQAAQAWGSLICLIIFLVACFLMNRFGGGGRYSAGGFVLDYILGGDGFSGGSSGFGGGGFSGGGGGFGGGGAGGGW